jgi:autotransporter-associated beta strand protein
MYANRKWSTPNKRRLSLIPLILLSSLSRTAHAQFTNTWTGLGTTSNWSLAANWQSNLVPVSAASTSLDFTGTAATSNNDLGTFVLNLMQFDVTAALTMSGDDLNFVSNGNTLPALTQNSASSITINNNVALSSNFTVNLTAGGNVNLAGVVSGAGSLTITGSQSNYTTILSNSANSYTGNTTITGGTLQLGANNALTSGTELYVTGTTAGAMLDLNGHNVTVGDIFFADGTAQSTNSITIGDTAGGGILTLNGNITYQPYANLSNPDIPVLYTPSAYLNSNLALTSGQHVIDNNDTGAYTNQYYDVVVAGQISGAGGLDIGTATDSNIGPFVALTNGANAYQGQTNILNGRLYLGTANALPSNTAVTLSDYGALYLYVDSSTVQSGVTAGNYNQTIGSLANAPGSTDLSAVYLGSGTLTVGGNNASTVYSGTIADNDGTGNDFPTGGNLVKIGTGTLTLSGNNIYTGSTTIDNGTLQSGANYGLPITDLILNGGAFDLNGTIEEVNTVTNNGGNVLVQNSAGILQVNGAYTQSAGTTQVDGTLNLTPDQDLSLTGGNLVGTGTIGNATSSGTITVTNSGGTVKPGDLLPSVTVGTLTINGNYAQTSSGTLEIDLAGTNNNDLLKVTNNANLAGTLNIKLLNGFVPTVGETFNFLNYGIVSGNFANIVGLDPGYTYTDSFANGIGTITVVTAAVPETSTLFAATLMLGAGGLLVRRQRRLSRRETVPAA